MVFSTKTLHSSFYHESINTNCKKEHLLSEHDSFFQESMNFIQKESLEFQKLLFEQYHVVNEGLGLMLIGGGALIAFLKKMNYKKLVENILHSFTKLLDYLWKRFKVFFLQTSNSKTVISRFDKELKSIDSNVLFSGERYIYTNLGSNTSYTSLKIIAGRELSDFVLDLSELHDCRSLEQQMRKMEDIKDKVDTTDEYYDQVRGDLVGSYDGVTKEEFGNALYQYFRNGGNKIITPNILPSEIHTIYKQYKNNNHTIKMVEKDKSDMSVACSNLQKEIKRLDLKNYIKDDASAELNNIFISITQNKITRLKNICEIFGLFFGAKLDAIKEMNLQNREILMSACKQLVKEGN